MAVVCFAVLLAQSGSTSDTELSFEWTWQKMPHGEGAAPVPLSRGSTTRGYGHGGESSEPLRGLCAGMSERRGSREGAAACGARPGWAGTPGRRLEPPQECGMAAGLGCVFQKVLGFVSLRVQQACASLLLGVVVGNEGELSCWGF